jgi:hypothetical protein
VGPALTRRTGAVVAGSSAPIRWRIQGTRGGEELIDRVRGHCDHRAARRP